MSIESILKWSLNTIELAAACTGLILWKKWKGTPWKWLAVFLLFIFLTEILGKYFHYNIPLRRYNPFLYRYFNIPVTILFYLWLLEKGFRTRKSRSWMLIFISLYCAAWIVEEFMLPPVYKKFGTLSYQVGSIGILIFAIFYFIQLANSEKVLRFKQDLLFWVSMGLIVYHIVTLPFNALRTSLYTSYPDFFTYYWYITFLFNFFMYGCIISGFIWGKAK